jgi:hypothetical protein
MGEKLGGFDFGEVSRQNDEAVALLFAHALTLSREAARALVEYGRYEARAILTQHSEAFQALVDALLSRETLDGSEIDKIILGAEEPLRAERDRLRRAEDLQRSERVAEFESQCAPGTISPPRHDRRLRQ